jgi:hypothetical protein
LGAVLCGVFSGCGGQAERTIDDSGGEQGSGEQGSGDPGGDAPQGDIALGPCTKGFERFANLDKKCNWLGEGLCYDTKEAACACICPPVTNSVCISGFYDGEGSATPVYCD